MHVFRIPSYVLNVDSRDSGGIMADEMGKEWPIMLCTANRMLNWRV